jgi:hypothetical protein
MSRLVGGRSIYLIGTIAHWAIYSALLLALVPFRDQPATWVLCIGLAAVGAYTWPILDYFIVAVVATVSGLCAICFVAVMLAAVWLTARLAEEAEELEQE